jgi:heat shock protein HslJ
MTPLRRRLAWLVAILTAVALLTSCVPGSTLAPGSPVGRWGSADDTQTHLSLLEDGTALGNDGCNGMGGEWRLEDDTVIFVEMFMTLMACPGHDSWLGGMASAVVIGDQLYVFDSEGDQIGILPRLPGVSR